MGVLGIVLAVIAALVLLTAAWSARQPRSGRRKRDRDRDELLRRRRNREDLL